MTYEVFTVFDLSNTGIARVIILPVREWLPIVLYGVLAVCFLSFTNTLKSTRTPISVRSISHVSFTSVFGQQKSLVSRYPFKHLQESPWKVPGWSAGYSWWSVRGERSIKGRMRITNGGWRRGWGRVFRTKSNLVSETVRVLSGSDC